MFDDEYFVVVRRWTKIKKSVSANNELRGIQGRFDLRWQWSDSQCKKEGTDGGWEESHAKDVTMRERTRNKTPMLDLAETCC